MWKKRQCQVEPIWDALNAPRNIQIFQEIQWHLKNMGPQEIQMSFVKLHLED